MNSPHNTHKHAVKEVRRALSNYVDAKILGALAFHQLAFTGTATREFLRKQIDDAEAALEKALEALGHFHG